VAAIICPQLSGNVAVVKDPVSQNGYGRLTSTSVIAGTSPQDIQAQVPTVQQSLTLHLDCGVGDPTVTALAVPMLPTVPLGGVWKRAGAPRARTLLSRRLGNLRLRLYIPHSPSP
jgi:hypothetical protein